VPDDPNGLIEQDRPCEPEDLDMPNDPNGLSEHDDLDEPGEHSDLDMPNNPDWSNAPNNPDGSDKSDNPDEPNNSDGSGGPDNPNGPTTHTALASPFFLFLSYIFLLSYFTSLSSSSSICTPIYCFISLVFVSLLIESRSFSWVLGSAPSHLDNLLIILMSNGSENVPWCFLNHLNTTNLQS